MIKTSYPLVKSRPVAKFKYSGSHSKKVRRCVILTEVTRNIIRGYEVREGNEVRDLSDEVIKSYNRDKIEGLSRSSLSDSTTW